MNRRMNPTRRRLGRRGFIKAVVPTMILPRAAQSSSPGKDSRTGSYRVRLLEDASFEVKSDGASWHRFVPAFSILYRQDNPGLRMELDSGTAFRVPTWHSVRGGKATMDLFEAAQCAHVTASDRKQEGNLIRWEFPADHRFSLTAELFSSGVAEPRLHFRFTPHAEGWYSVGFSGAPEIEPENADGIWQPFVWQERRFPSQSYLSMQHMCPIPAALVSANGNTVGVSAMKHNLHRKGIIRSLRVRHPTAALEGESLRELEFLRARVDYEFEQLGIGPK